MSTARPEFTPADVDKIVAATGLSDLGRVDLRGRLNDLRDAAHAQVGTKRRGLDRGFLVDLKKMAVHLNAVQRLAETLAKRDSFGEVSALVEAASGGATSLRTFPRQSGTAHDAFTKVQAALSEGGELADLLDADRGSPLAGLVPHLAVIYRRAFGKRAGISKTKDGAVSGPFVRFALAVLNHPAMPDGGFQGGAEVIAKHLKGRRRRGTLFPE